MSKIELAWKVHIPFDVLPNMVHRSLTHGLLRNEDVKIIADLPGRVRFVLTTDTQVHLGEISVEKMSDIQTLLYVSSLESDPFGDDIQETLLIVLAGFRARLTAELESRARHLGQPIENPIEFISDIA